jgi:hypothetical protein
MNLSQRRVKDLQVGALSLYASGGCCILLPLIMWKVSDGFNIILDGQTCFIIAFLSLGTALVIRIITRKEMRTMCFWAKELDVSYRTFPENYRQRRDSRPRAFDALRETQKKRSYASVKRVECETAVDNIRQKLAVAPDQYEKLRTELYAAISEVQKWKKLEDEAETRHQARLHHLQTPWPKGSGVLSEDEFHISELRLEEGDPETETVVISLFM